MVPRPGNECRWAPDGNGAGITLKILPPALYQGGVWRVKTRPVTNTNNTDTSYYHNTQHDACDIK